MRSGIIGTVIEVRKIATQSEDINLFDIQSGDRAWRMPKECFTYPIPENVVPMFSEPLAIREVRAQQQIADMKALAQRLRGDYDDE